MSGTILNMNQEPEASLQEADIARLREEGNLKKFSQLLNSYNMLFQVVNRFLYDDSHSDDLKMTLHYKELRSTTDRLMQELLLRTDDASAIKIKRYFIPFPNLLTAEEDHHKRGVPFDKEKIKREMRAALGEMKELSMEINAISGIPDEKIEEALREYRGCYMKVSDWMKIDPAGKRSPLASQNVFYNQNLGKFTFNEDETNAVTLEGNQKDVADCLVDNGKDAKVSWDQLFDSIGDNIGPKDTDAAKRTVRTAVTEINKHVAKYLSPGKDFIDCKNNEYWLQYEVDKGR